MKTIPAPVNAKGQPVAISPLMAIDMSHAMRQWRKLGKPGTLTGFMDHDKRYVKTYL